MGEREQFSGIVLFTLWLSGVLFGLGLAMVLAGAAFGYSGIVASASSFAIIKGMGWLK